MDLKDNQAKVGRICLSKFVLGIVRRVSSSINQLKKVTGAILITIMLSLLIFPLALRVFPLINTISSFSSLPYTWTVDCLC